MICVSIIGRQIDGKLATQGGPIAELVGRDFLIREIRITKKRYEHRRATGPYEPSKVHAAGDFILRGRTHTSRNGRPHG
ncbi:MAG TPA: hypothetical protein VFF58_00955, partial [Candidatus Nitrosotalea sp.]|nr:hypothetical protein [Candidatus Nitrosotalea sp.]